MICKKCGKKLDAGARFCGQCGEPVIFEPLDPQPKKNTFSENSKVLLEKMRQGA